MCVFNFSYLMGLLLATTQPQEAEISFVSKYSGACPSDQADTQDAVVGMIKDQFSESKSVFCFLDDVSNFCNPKKHYSDNFEQKPCISQGSTHSFFGIEG